MQTELIKVTGMTCGGCTSNVTRALTAHSGVNDVNVSLATGKVTVQYDEKLTSPEQLKSVIKLAGYGVDASNTMQQDKVKQAKGCCG